MTDLANEIKLAEERTGETIHFEQIEDLTVLFYIRPNGSKQVVATI